MRIPAPLRRSDQFRLAPFRRNPTQVQNSRRVVAGDFTFDAHLPQAADDVVVVNLSLRHVRLVGDGDGRRSLADPHVVPPQHVLGIPLRGRG